MCGIAAATLAVSAISSAAAYKGQQDQAKAQTVANNNRAKAASEAARFQYEQLETQRVQIEDATTDELMGLETEKMERVAQARNSAASSGIAGISVDAFVGEMEMKGGQAAKTIEGNRDNMVDNVRAQGRSVYMQARSRATPTAVTEPSLGALVAGVGKGYIGYKSLKDD